MKRILKAFCLWVLPLFLANPAFAQASKGVGVSRPLVLLFVLAVMALAPFIIMMATSFAKLAVVLSLIRNAIGTQQVPPNVIVTGLALILTVYIMAPVGSQVYKAAGDVIRQETNQPALSQATLEMFMEAAKRGREPIRAFLLKHTHKEEKRLFYDLSVALRTDKQEKESIKDDDFLNLIPAFVISELAEAFQIGFVIFLPFLILDLVIANILLSLGMFQISPVTISLPFKLLLFVMVNGWQMIVEGLIRGYL